MEEKTKDRSRIEMSPYSKVERETDILEQLYIWRKQGTEATEVRIGRQFDIPKKTAAALLKQMTEKGYIYPYAPNKEIILTPYGISEGNECFERHSSISQFLQYIGVTEETAEQDACRAEHFFADETVKALCTFANADIRGYERRIKNSELTDRYAKGNYVFMMQIYSMGQNRPRTFREENFWYTGDITLEIADSGWFELQYAKEEYKFQKKLWYKNAGKLTEDWTEAEKGRLGERIPANAFEFIVKASETLVEGSLLIALTEPGEEPDIWNSCQLEVELW